MSDFGYERWPDVEAEIRRVRGLNRFEWMAEAKDLKNETLVFLILQIEKDDPELLECLLQEVSDRTVRISTCWAQGLDDPVATEEIVREVDRQVLELLLSPKTSPRAEFLEASFAFAVRRRTIDALRKHKRSAMGRRGELFFHIEAGAEDSDIEPLDLLPDGGLSPERMFLQGEVYDIACKVVKDPRHLEAVILFYCDGWPVESNDPDKPDLAHYFNATPRQVRYWITTAMQAIREAIGVNR